MCNYKTLSKRIESLINLKDVGVSKDDLLKKLSNEHNMIMIRERAKTLTIGAAILVKNQENKIESAIKSIERIVDSIFVYDTGSTDSTIGVIKSMSTDKIVLNELEWVENYSLMRNISIKHLDTDWVLIIDSDEILQSDFSRESLKMLLASIEFLIHSKNISLCFKQYSIGIDGQGFPQRLFRNTSEVKFFGYIHEELRGKDLVNIKTTISVLNSGTEDLDLKKFNKVERYDRLLLKNIEDEPTYNKWLALLSINYILKNIDYYLELVSTRIAFLKSNNIPTEDYFDLKIFMTYVNILITEKKDYEKASIELEFGKKLFYDNPIFYYFEYLIKINNMQQNALELVYKLKNDVNNLKNKQTGWEVFYPINSLEPLMINLLMKSELYDFALDMVCDYQAIDKELIKKEIIEKL